MEAWYIYVMEYYSAIKKNETMPFAATWMDKEIVMHSEVSKAEKENIVWHLLYVKQKQIHRLRE